MKNLRKNNLFLILTPILAFAVMSVVQFFLFNAYVDWTPWLYALLEVLHCASFTVFAFWLAVVFGKDKPISKFHALFTVIAAAVFIFINLGVPYLINNVLDYAVTIAMGTALVVSDLCALFLFGIGYGQLLACHDSKKVTITVCACVLAIIMGLVGAFAGLAISKSETNSASSGLNAKQSFEVFGSVPDGDGKDVKVILLGGQSNATGCSYCECLKNTISAEEYAKYVKGFDNVQINFCTENGGNHSLGFVDVTLGQGFGELAFGPEVGIAETLSSAYPDETVFIIKYTWGGSNLHTQWKAPTNGEQGGELYTAFISYVSTAMDYLLDNGYNATIGAMCWMQGESDSDAVNSLVYGANSAALITSIRSDLAEYISADGMTFIDAGISDSVIWTNYSIVNAQKQALKDTIPQYVYIDTIAEGLEYNKEPDASNPDVAHYDATSQIKLGHLFGSEILKRYAD